VGANSKEECLLGFGGERGEGGNSMKERKKENRNHLYLKNTSL